MDFAFAGISAFSLSMTTSGNLRTTSGSLHSKIHSSQNSVHEFGLWTLDFGRARHSQQKLLATLVQSVYSLPRLDKVL